MMQTIYVVSVRDEDEGWEEEHFTPNAAFTDADEADSYALSFKEMIKHRSDAAVTTVELDGITPPVREGLRHYFAFVKDDGSRPTVSITNDPIRKFWIEATPWGGYYSYIEAHNRAEAEALAPVLLAKFLKEREGNVE